MIKIESIVDSVRLYLEDSIFSGRLIPGQQIKEQELATALGISRPPIREALKIMEAEGLIMRKPNRGAFVTRIGEKDVWEIYSLKKTLYDLATDLAFNRISRDHIITWEEIIERMDGCASCSPPDVTEYQNLNQRFHTIMLDLSGHDRLKKIASTLHNQVKAVSSKSLADCAHLSESLRYHHEILEAIKQRDLNKTKKLTREHIDTGLEHLNRILADMKPLETAAET